MIRFEPGGSYEKRSAFVEAGAMSAIRRVREKTDLVLGVRRLTLLRMGQPSSECLSSWVSEVR